MTALVTWKMVQEWTGARSQNGHDTERQDTEEIQDSVPARGQAQAQTAPAAPQVMGKRQQSLETGDYQDLRSQCPPQDPQQLEQQFSQMVLGPKSPPEATICRCEPPHMEDVRIRRWHWWRELAKVQLYVKSFTCTLSGLTGQALQQRVTQDRRW